MKFDENSFLLCSEEQKREIHFKLCEAALEVWLGYFLQSGPKEYFESVAGTKQSVDPEVLSEALAAARTGKHDNSIRERLGEIRVALYDGDLKLPEKIEFAFICIDKLTAKYVTGENLDDWLIVELALSALPDDDISKIYEQVVSSCLPPYVFQASGNQVVVKVIDERTLVFLRTLGFVAAKESGYELAIKSEQEKANIFSQLRDFGFCFASGKEWNPCEVFEYLRDKKLVSGSFKEISWKQPYSWKIRER